MFFTSLPVSAREAIIARSRNRSVALPEGSDPRVLRAAALLKENFNITARLGMPEVAKKASEATLTVMQSTAAARGKTLSPEAASLAEDPFYEAGACLSRGEVDAVVGGCVASTAHVIRAALGTVGLKPGIKTITSGFLLGLKNPTAGGESLLLYADGAVIPQPSSAQLVDIAFLASQAFAAWSGMEARVAFLSFSTAGSAEHPDVHKVRTAAQEFFQKYPQIIAEGEVQFDTATVPEIARRKNPATKLAGCANVMIFPDLDAGNIGYKMAQRLAGAEAWGPVLFGSAKPFSDLSRGASDTDIVQSVLLTLALGSY